MLIVLQLVFAVAVSVLLVLMISKQEDYKAAAAAQSGRAVALSATLVAAEQAKLAATDRIAVAEAAKVAAETALTKERELATAAAGTAQNRILGLEGDVKVLQNQNQALSLAASTASNSIALKDKELEEIRPKLSQLNTQNAELARKNNELQSALQASELAIRKMQEQLAAGAAAASAASSSGGQVQAMSSGTSVSAAVNAKITKVADSAGRILIEMPLGSRDGITQGTQMFVYRSTGYVGDAVVERVTPTTSVAVVTRTKEGQTVQQGDTISTIGR
jgi:hypothetical protein